MSWLKRQAISHAMTVHMLLLYLNLLGFVLNMFDFVLKMLDFAGLQFLTKSLRGGGSDLH